MGQTELPAGAGNAGRGRGAAFRSVAALLCALFAVVVIRAGWLCDDAYITFRSVDNLLSGLGATWNPDERVQTYTHPLWMLLLAAVCGLTGDWHAAPIITGAAVSVAACARLVLGAPGIAAALLVGSAMLLSRAFVDYSTSGLENPLSHLLVAIFLGVHLRAPGLTDPAARLRLLSLVAALCALTRLDLVALVAPAIASRALQLGARRSLAALLPALVPVLAWEVFSLVYYGSWLPNSALAKLGTGIAFPERVVQGLHYLANSWRQDPVTLGAIALAAVLCGFPGASGRRSAALGVAAYLTWVVGVGGDFMSGRMLTVPLLASLAIAASSRAPGGSPGALLPVGLVVALGAAGPHPTWTNDASYPERVRIAGHNLLDRHGIADERGAYFPYTGLLRADPAVGPRDHPWAADGAALRERGVELAIRGAVGLFGFYVGPGVHVVDYFAIGDPLLARLPARDDRDLRVGHFERRLPRGYVPSLVRGGNRIADVAVASCFDDVRLATRGPLFTRARWVAIWRLGAAGSCRGEPGAFAADPGRSGPEPLLAITFASLCSRPGAAPLDIAGGIDVYLPEPRRPEAITLELGSAGHYAVQLLLGLETVAGNVLPPPARAGASPLSPRRFALPPVARESGFDRLRVLPLRRDTGLLGSVALAGSPEPSCVETETGTEAESASER